MNIYSTTVKTLTARQEQALINWSYRLRTDGNAPYLPPQGNWTNSAYSSIRKAYPGGLTGIPLDGTLKHLYWAGSPIRNSVTRVPIIKLAGWNGSTLQWRAITQLNSTGNTGTITSPRDAGAEISYGSASYTVTVGTLGEKGNVYRDDIDDAKGYNDPLADDIRQLYVSGQRIEELAFLFRNSGATPTGTGSLAPNGVNFTGNGGVDIAEVNLVANTPTIIAPLGTGIDPGNTLSHLNFMVVPLTGYGWANKDLNNGLLGIPVARTPVSGTAFNDVVGDGGHYGPYNVAHSTIDLGSSVGAHDVVLTWTLSQSGAQQPRPGAHAYAIFWNVNNAGQTFGASSDYSILTVVGNVQSIRISSLPFLTTTGTGASTAVIVRALSELATSGANAATTTASALGNYKLPGYSGFMTQMDASAATSTPAYEFDCGANANPATLAGQLQSDGATGIVQIENAIIRFFLLNGIAPTKMWCAPQQKSDISRKIVASNPAGFRIMTQSGAMDITGGLVAGNGYVSRFAEGLSGADNGMGGLPTIIPIVASRDMPPGQILLLAERLPFIANNVTNAIQYAFVSDWYVDQFARVDRSYPHGVYTRGTLQLYFPQGSGMITNILPG